MPQNNPTEEMLDPPKEERHYILKLKDLRNVCIPAEDRNVCMYGIGSHGAELGSEGGGGKHNTRQSRVYSYEHVPVLPYLHPGKAPRI